MEPVARVQGTDGASLSCSGRVVARYMGGAELPCDVSPRPYLHPVTTLAGTQVTGFMPVDHRHHLGASVAIPSINDMNFWGGRTYVRGKGSVSLDNHGVQRHTRWLRQDPDCLIHELSWDGSDGDPVAREERSVTARALTTEAWLLSVEFTLFNTGDCVLTIDSPGARGRAGAGYGGFFWRAPADLAWARAFGAGDVHGAAVHGSRLPWVALAGSQPEHEPWTLVFAAGHGGAASGGAVAGGAVAGGGAQSDPWFVRAEDYAGVCSAVAWDRALLVAPHDSVSRWVSVLVADGVLTPETVEATLAAARAEA